MNNLVPAVRKSVHFLRHEKNNHLLIINNHLSINEGLIVNSLGHKIIDLCTGENRIGQIIEALEEQYPDVSRETITNDANMFINKLSKLNIIKWKGECPPMYNGKYISKFLNGYNVWKCGEGSVNRIKHLINCDDLFIKFNGSFSGDIDYNPLNLRAKIFNYMEEFYIIEHGGTDFGLVSILPIDNDSFKYGVTNLFLLLSEIDTSVLGDIVRCIIKDINDCCGISKVRIHFKGSQNNLLNYTDKLMFREVARFEREFVDNSDLIIQEAVL